MTTENEMSKKRYAFEDTLIEYKYPILKKFGIKTRVEKDVVLLSRPTNEDLLIPTPEHIAILFDTVLKNDIDLFAVMKFISSDVEHENQSSRENINDYFCKMLSSVENLALEKPLDFIIDSALANGVTNGLIYFNGINYYLSDLGRFLIKNIKIVDKT